jgi:hypothetical protein
VPARGRTMAGCLAAVEVKAQRLDTPQQ